MIQFICYFFPAIVAVWITEACMKENFNLKKFIYHYGMYTALINITIYMIITLFFSPVITYLTPESFTYNFTIKYLGIALLLAIALPIIYKIIKNRYNNHIALKRSSIYVSILASYQMVEG